jgi:hypothetical protein
VQSIDLIRCIYNTEPKMAARKASPTKKSRGRVTTKESPGGSPKGPRSQSRAQRQDTPEAKVQRARAPKTHPTRTPGSMRKDKIA